MIRVRPIVIPWDFRQLLKLEEESHEYPWTKSDFISQLEQEEVHSLVLEQTQNRRIPGRILAFTFYSYHRSWIVQILNFTVDKQLRRNGIGKFLFKKLLDVSLSRQQGLVYLIVREANLQAQLFFRAMGLRGVTPILKGWYEDIGEDAYIMEYRYGSEQTFDPSILKNRISTYYKA